MKPTTIGQTKAIVLLALVLATGACADRKAEEKTEDPSATPQAQPSQTTPAPDQATPEKRNERDLPAPKAPAPPAPPAAPAPDPEREKKDPTKSTPLPPVVVPEPVKPEPARPQETKPATPAQPAPERTAPAQRQVAAKDVVVLTGAPMGGVRLDHKKHVQFAGNTCTSCHHPSKPEKPLTSPQQACSDCHTKAAAAPMKTTYQRAFHNPTAQAGTCIDCHKTENAKGKTAPLKCAECHKKENR